MEDLNSLSNEELKYRLTQYGFPNMPVTITTRKVLIKKLKNHMDSEKTKLKRETSYATRYSSDEDLSSNSDFESTTRSSTSTITSGIASKKQRGNLPRSTIAAMSQSGRSSTATAANRSNLIMPPPSATQTTAQWTESKSQISGANKSNSLIYISPLIQSDTDEESDTNQSDLINVSQASRYSNNAALGISSRASIGGTSNTSYHGNDISSIGRELFDPHEKSSYSSSLNATPVGGTGSTNGVHDYEDSPYLSTNFTKRLLSFRNRNFGSNVPQPTAPVLDSSKRFDRFSSPSYNLAPSRTLRYLNESNSLRLSGLSREDHSIVYQAQSEYSKRQPINQSASFSILSMFSSIFNRFNEKYAIKQSLVPCILLTSLFIFFASVIITYLTMNPDLSVALDAKAAVYKICPPTEIGFSTIQPTINCIEETQLDQAFNLLKKLIPELQKRIEFNRCTDSSAPFAMRAAEVVNFVLTLEERSVVDTIRTLNNAEYLISLNPQWRVGNFRDANCQATSSISINELSRLRENKSNYFAIVKPRLPVACFLYKKLQTMFTIIGWIGVIAIVCYAFVFIVKFIRSHLQTRRERLNNMIEDITNVLMEKAYDPDTACTDAASIVVNHLRDKLIPAAERSKMESVWNAAIRFIEQNESRIQFSVATRNGEDYRVMRWIDTTPINQNSIVFSNSGSSISGSGSGSIGNNAIGACSASNAGPIVNRSSSSGFGNVKKWQSPAFDKTNQIKDPPTECLKIRQMFEKFEATNPSLKQIIQDAILEKVAHTTCKIYDIQLDKQTCCVYVRCATAKDAGIIHDEVNGWWFDSRLVSIKFLRLDRYLNRFPNSASGPTILKPSNSRNLSMTNNLSGGGGSDDKRNGNGKRGSDDIDDDDEDDDNYYYNNN